MRQVELPMGLGGIEPPTFRTSSGCSPTELKARLLQVQRWHLMGRTRREEESLGLIWLVALAHRLQNLRRGQRTTQVALLEGDRGLDHAFIELPWADGNEDWMHLCS